jgi:hypothetical protein
MITSKNKSPAIDYASLAMDSIFAGIGLVV